jgi:hypothetical protein
MHSLLLLATLGKIWFRHDEAPRFLTREAIRLKDGTDQPPVRAPPQRQMRATRYPALRVGYGVGEPPVTESVDPVV